MVEQQNCGQKQLLSKFHEDPRPRRLGTTFNNIKLDARVQVNLLRGQGGLFEISLEIDFMSVSNRGE